jgi:hypothetical protein
VDRSAAPWRVLETRAASDPAGDDRGTDPEPAEDGIAGIPVPWLVAGAVSIMIALGLVGNVAHWRKNTIGTSTSATASVVNGATRGSRRLAQNTPVAMSQ